MAKLYDISFQYSKVKRVITFYQLHLCIYIGYVSNFIIYNSSCFIWEIDHELRIKLEKRYYE